MDRYDRQLRLWNSDGQHSLRSSRICVVGNLSSLATEILKNLVLPGVGEVVLIDDGTLVESRHLNSNFFLSADDLQGNTLLAAALQKNLSLLNPDVTIKLHRLSSDDEKFWHNFNAVILVPYYKDDTVLNNIENLLWDLNIPLFKAFSLGFYSYLRIQFHELSVIQSHQSSVHDLRIDSPWPQLSTFIDSIDLNDTSIYYKIPYSVILGKIYSKLLSENGNEGGNGGGNENENHTCKILPSQVRLEIKKLQKSGDELNLIEASTKAALIRYNSSAISSDLQKLFNNDKCKNLNSHSTIFWILVNALKQFYNEFSLLPLNGDLPDMESTTEYYMELKNIYSVKAAADLNYIKDKCLKSLQLLNRDDLVSDSVLKIFIKNCRSLQNLTGSQLSNDLDLILKSNNSELINKSVIYLAFLLSDLYSKQNMKYPIPESKSSLRSFAIATLIKEKIFFPDGLDKILDELCRSDLAQIHNIHAIMGGITAQEVIKFLTNQYIPLDNTLVFDGIQGNMVSFKI